jgi:hypothetical protein
MTNKNLATIETVDLKNVTGGAAAAPSTNWSAPQKWDTAGTNNNWSGSTASNWSTNRGSWGQTA